MKISILLLAALFIGCSSDKVQVAAPVIQSLPVIALHNSSETTFTEYPASIQGAVDLEIRPQVSGSLDKIYVNEGALVQKGQPLFKINELPFKEAVNNAKALLHAAQAAVTNAQLEVDKLTPLVANKVVSDFQLKSAKATLQSAQASVEQARAGVATANINLGYTLIKAPVTGYVGRLPRKQGSLVGTTDAVPLTQLSDAHEVHVYFSLGEDDFINFNATYPGKTIADRLKKLPGVALVLADRTVYAQEGKIDMVDGQFDKQTGSIALRATFPNTQGLLRSGNTGKLRLSISHPDAILVPQSSTIEVQDKMFVYTVDAGNKVSKTPITILGTTGINYLVKEGVKAGDKIVFDGIDKLKEGEVIKPEKLKEEPIKTALR
ncbi:efflux RND transporter periplasmic adaptor subunit [Pedobacter cryoconitis]|uniref:Membrane fusion protein (Multidrug efflux system) n=1 Tax=Pedobacter cryoconitis TaxID=188932 RepID=A0A327TGU7_9SPHI|nr:efflux RND transporter periplasmic adaptor subunit [Pedobacter cryoconitis]MBB5619063.1 membrane fusion protein (multidrug efflux system) [Pedobacter cryoconitis]MBB5644359.1 membrane fusion protein (multidrug efflux system) [Pedobacter cryoconitis]RAJ37027.1 membrane fusion protein (multidrug efflux system) [Pedobacter cryoconitis]